MQRSSRPTPAWRVVGLAVPALAAAVMLLSPGPLWANGSDHPAYRMELVVQSGDRAGGVQTVPDGHLGIGSLNDHGQLVFTVANAAGGQALLQYDVRGWRWWERFTPIAAANGGAPTGKWAADLAVWGPVSMNARGDSVFSTTDSEAFARLWNAPAGGTFRWDAKAQQVLPVALNGSPAAHGLTFVQAGGPHPVINNRGDIVMVGLVKNAAGSVRSGVFYVAPSGSITPVAVPGQTLPDGRTIAAAADPSLNDFGTVAFLARAEGETRYSAYSWQQGTITPIASPAPGRIGIAAETPATEGFAAITGVRVTSSYYDVLVGARLPGSQNVGLYRYRIGKKPLALAVPGQPMPGGGVFQSLLEPQQGLAAVSYSNQLGRHAFLATIGEAGRVRTAAYLVDETGKLSLILKSGMMSDIGPVVNVGLATRLLSGSGSSGIGLNSKGQVALTMKISDAPNMIVLLTPTASAR
jgi:hypothetical protein